MRAAAGVLLLIMSLSAASSAGQGRPQMLPNLHPQPRPPSVLDTLWMVGGAEDRGGVSFGSIADVAVDSSGRILVVDHVNVMVHVLDRAGKLIGAIGKKGAGPGEFRAPARVAVAPDGMIYVLDAYDARLSEYDPNLKFLRSFLLQPMLTVRSMRVTEDAILVAGIERLSRSAHEILHEFSRSDGTRRRSWGELLPASTPEAAREVGAGVFAVGAHGLIWYVSPGPYRIEGFDGDRRRVAWYERPNDFLPPSEQRVTRSVSGGRVSLGYHPQAFLSEASIGVNGTLRVVVILLGGERVVDEYAVTHGSGAAGLVLRSSTQLGGPILTPRHQAGPDTFVVDGNDTEGAGLLVMVRIRSGGR